jgi:predicted nuclease with TOPRIM domain
MRAQLEQRLHELRAEFEAGHKILAELEAKQVHLRETLLRISGAIQVLEEELAKAAQPQASIPGPAGGASKMAIQERTPENLR